VKQLVLISLLSALALVACDRDADSGADAGADTDVDSDTDADADADSDTTACVETFASFEGDLVIAGGHYDGDEIVIKAYEGYEDESCGCSTVAGLILRDAAVGDYDLASQGQYQSCDKCLVLGVNCSIPAVTSCMSHYIATTGTLNLVMVVEPEPWDNHFEFLATDVILEEALLDWETGESEPLPNAERICIDHWHLSVELANWN
jgi:hypothetical protein